VKNLLAMLILATLFSCGGYSSGGSSYSAPTPQQEQSPEGTFRAALNAENPSVSGATAPVQISLQGDQFQAQINFGNGPNTTHAQHIHGGSRCPTPADDTNQDGVIDAAEATAVYGPVVDGTFPSGPGYVYNQSASFSQMLANLNLTSFNLEGKVVNIHGVPDSVNLPATAQGAKADFPIACGVLQREAQ
jgi:hypothetical protein